MGLLLALTTIPVIGTTNRLMTARFAELDAFAAQKDGLQYLLSVRDLIQHTAEHRGMTFAFLNGDQTFRTRIDAKRDQVDADINQLSGLTSEHVPPVNTLASWSRVNRTWQDLKSTTRTPEENFDQHSEMVNDLLTLNAEVADATTLLLGNSELIFYIADIVTFKSPALAESLGILRGQVSGAIASGNLSAARQGQLMGLLAQVKTHQRQLDRSFEIVNIEGQATQAHRDQNRAISDFLAASEQAINGNTSMNASDLFDLGTEAIAKSFSLYDQLLVTLERAIDAEVDDIYRRISTGLPQLGVIGLVFVAAFWLLLQSILKPLQQAAISSRAIADGDLTRNVEVDSLGEDELAELLTSTGEMQERLYDVVTGIRTASDTVVYAANQVKDGNLALSQQSQEQAHSINDITASMQQMTEFVNDNASHAAAAVEKSEASEREANRGSDVVARAVQAMDRVSESSQKVQEIVGVIDGIAFQTNLLALNAAVEAARAGDSGRGFAVVAGEVRNLSGRSAVAAKEIKELIDETLERINAGHRHVNESGKVFEDIAHEIASLSDMVKNIAIASREQAERLHRVNDSIGTIDSMTQQNAALVEEAAASAEAMEAQAENLLQMVAFFDTGDQKQTEKPKAQALLLR